MMKEPEIRMFEHIVLPIELLASQKETFLEFLFRLPRLTSLLLQLCLLIYKPSLTTHMKSMMTNTLEVR